MVLFLFDETLFKLNSIVKDKNMFQQFSKFNMCLNFENLIKDVQIEEIVCKQNDKRVKENQNTKKWQFIVPMPIILFYFHFSNLNGLVLF